MFKRHLAGTVGKKKVCRVTSQLYGHSIGSISLFIEYFYSLSSGFVGMQAERHTHAALSFTEVFNGIECLTIFRS